MRRDELIKRLQEIEKGSAVTTAWGILFVVGFLSAFVGYAWFGLRFVLKTPSRVLGWAFFASLVVCVIAYLVFLMWWAQRQRRKSRLCCPSCNDLYPIGRLVDILSNRCSRCGGQLFELGGESGGEESNEYVAVQALRQEELRRRIQEFNKQFGLRAVGIAIAFCGANFTFAALVFVGYAKAWSAVPRWLLLAAMIALIIAGLKLIFREQRKLIRKYGLYCSHCGYTYDLHSIDDFVTNKCKRCGRALFDFLS